MRRLVTPLLLLALLAAAPAAEAITRSEAAQAARQALRRELRGDNVRLHVLRTRVPAGARVGQGLPPEQARRVARRSWLVWLDLNSGAAFAHPSVLVLVDDRTARVTRRLSMSWWPELNGRRLFAGAQRRQVAPRRRARRAQVTGLRNDCIVTIGDRTDPYFLKGMAAITALGNRHGMPVAAARRGADLGPAIDDLARRDPPCTDVMIYIAGHGWGPPNTDVRMPDGGPIATSDEARVTIKAPAAGGQPAVEENLSASDVRRLMDARPNLTFKLVVESCFSGRWQTLMAAPNLRITLTSSSASEVTFLAVTHAQRARQKAGTLDWDENAPVGDPDTPEDPPPFTKGFVQAFDEWVRAGAQGGELGAGIGYAGTHREGDRARELGWTHGRTDDRTRERPHAPPPSPPPVGKPPGGPSQQPFRVDVSGSHRHIGPGQSEVCFGVQLSPARPDAIVYVNVTGPGGYTARLEGRTDANGFARVRGAINQYGRYDATAEATGPDGYKASGSGSHDVTAEAGTCPAP